MKYFKELFDKFNNSVFSYTTKKEKRQIFSLAIGVFAALGISEAQNYVFASNYNSLPTQDEIKIRLRLDSLSQVLSEIESSDTLNKLDAYIVKRYSNLQLFDFNPNTVSEEELLKLGFTEKQAQNLLKYRENGGRFSCADDFRKLYGLRTMQYKYLKDHLIFSESDAYYAKQKTRNPKDSIFKAREKELFYFDPNTMDEEQMYKLGWSTKQIESFLKMRNEGKKFYVKKDLSTIFFIDTEKYKELEPYIRIDKTKVTDGNKAIDLNLASEEELFSAGISGSEAEKIIKFRDAVGYFYSVWQLADCGVDYNKVKKISSNLYTCMSVDIRKFNINKATKEELKQNPYFSDKQVAAVIKYRDEHGAIKHLSDMQMMNAFDDKEIRKIGHYIEF